MIILIIINTTIFLLISILHFYWAFGGKRFRDAAIPTSGNGKKSLQPGIVGTVVVAAGLLLFAIITAGNAGIFDHLVNRKYFHYATYPVGLIFFLRFIGEFNLVGLFKRVKGTAFARMDSKLYMPLCLIISGISFLIILQF